MLRSFGERTTVTGRAAVLTQFNRPLEMREFPLIPLATGEARVQIEAAGVCGSDVHMWTGRDPRTPLPMILGHEGIGRIHEVAGPRSDLLGRPLTPGDRVMWERGIMCGRCYTCVVEKQPALCPNRRTYGISVGCQDPPYFQGCYAEYLHLRAGCHILKIESEVDPAVLVQASCSGATAAHTVEEAGIRPGDTVVIQGPGPLGLFVLAFALRSGATRAVVIGTARSRRRLDLAREFGATHTFVMDETTEEDRLAFIRDLTAGRGAEAVIECTGRPAAFREGLRMVAPLGRYVLAGVSTPEGEVGFRVFEDLVRRNARIVGVWVSDTSHLVRAIRLVKAGGFPFDKLIDHRCRLDDATDALVRMRDRRIIKAAILPNADA
jgi:threonine dehydrogenase-like Zn-dependent dehydrogenase